MPPGPVLSARGVLAALALLLGALLTAGCGGDVEAADVDPGDARPEAVLAAVDDGAVLIDVRTPEEFAESHLAGALNIDLASGRFGESVGTLDKSAAYVVYSRSEARAAAAAVRMVELGFEDVLLGGGFRDLVDAGVPQR